MFKNKRKVTVIISAIFAGLVAAWQVLSQQPAPVAIPADAPVTTPVIEPAPVAVEANVVTAPVEAEPAPAAVEATPVVEPAPSKAE